jgi:hypothetical protein
MASRDSPVPNPATQEREQSPHLSESQYVEPQEETEPQPTNPLGNPPQIPTASSEPFTTIDPRTFYSKIAETRFTQAYKESRKEDIEAMNQFMQTTYDMLSIHLELHDKKAEAYNNRLDTLEDHFGQRLDALGNTIQTLQRSNRQLLHAVQERQTRQGRPQEWRTGDTWTPRAGTRYSPTATEELQRTPERLPVNPYRTETQRPPERTTPAPGPFQTPTMHPPQVSAIPPLQTSAPIPRYTSTTPQLPPETTIDKRLPTIKGWTFFGKDGENIQTWIQSMEAIFDWYKLGPDGRYRTTYAMNKLGGDAQQFFWLLVGQSPNGVFPSWAQLKDRLIEKYDKTPIRADILRDQLHNMEYKGPSHMVEFCESFRSIEIQIRDMALIDKIRCFIAKVPGELYREIKKSIWKEMEEVYQCARTWAFAQASSTNRERTHSTRRPVVKFGGGNKRHSTLHVRKPSAPADNIPGIRIAEEELDAFYAIEMATVKCYNCGKYGHFSRHCKTPHTEKYRRFVDKKVRSGKRPKRKLYNMEQEEFSDDLSEIEDPNEQETDPLTMTSEESEDDALNLMNLYSYDEKDGDAKVSTVDGQTTKLPIYEAIREGLDDAPLKTVIDSGATTMYINEKKAKELGLTIHKVKKRHVKVADKEIVSVSGLVSFTMKLGNLPAEKITAYTFPLQGLDLILGLPWLRKHNPHVDWQNLSYEFTRNGRRYHLYPAKVPPKLRIVDVEELKNFLTEDTYLYVMTPEALNDKQKSSRQWQRKVIRWIQKRCKGLTRPLGEPANLEPFEINTGDAAPIKINPRPYSPLDLQKIRTFLDENLANGVISPSESPWSFPIVLAAKPNGGTRVCVDYRALNAITVKDAHPIPRMDESFTQFHGAKYFTSLDLRSGYWQILLSLAARLKTAFSTRYGHFHWNVLPFGISNAAGGFQRRINKVLEQFIDKFVIVYLDDTLIYSKTLEEHIQHVKAVLLALDKARLILNLEKCVFFAREIRFLGHIVSEHGCKPDPRNVSKVQDYPTPRTITDVRAFVNLARQYSRYVRDFAKIAKPLTDLQKGSPAPGTPIKWTEIEDRAFLRLKDLITSEPVVKHPKIGETFFIDPDSSQYAIGGALQQLFRDNDGIERLHPIAYESKKLTETEQRYSSQERELLAAKYCLDHWRHIIEGSPIYIRTDHESLRVYRSKKTMTKRLARFMAEIEHYDPTITYRPGRLQVVPDTLSRMPGLKEEGEPADTERFLEIGEDDKDKIEKEIDSRGETAEDDDDTETEENGPVHEKEKEKRKEEDKIRQNSDHFEKLVRYLKAKGIAADTPKDIIDSAKSFRLDDGRLVHIWSNREVIFKKEKCLEIVEAVHLDLGHYGKDTTKDAVRKRFIVATDLWKEGEKVLDSCVPCQLYKPSQKDPSMATAAIHPYPAKQPFKFWEIDFVGELIETPSGNHYLITAVDYATSKAIALAIPQRSSEIAIELLEHIIWTYGKPDEITTDNGTEFTSNALQALCEKWNIKFNPTTPGHPQTNGKVERLNHELIQRLQRIGKEEGNRVEDWDSHLQRALFAFHAHTNKRLGASPFFLQFGIEPTLPMTATIATPITNVDIAKAKERRKQVQDLSKYRTEAAEKYRKAIEKLASSRDDSPFIKGPIMPGDLVMREPINRKSKLHPKWDGPFIVLDSTENDIYQLGTANGYTIKNLINAQRLRKLDTNERLKYANDFWDASERLRQRDKRAAEQRELHDLDVQLRKATLDHLQAQKEGRPTNLEHTAELSKAKKVKLAELRTQPANPANPANASNLEPKVTEELGRGRRVRKATWKLLS